MVSKPILPVELVLVVFDYALYSGDYLTLASASRVCRSWTCPGQQRLFKSIVIRGERFASHFQDNISWLSVRPWLAMYVRDITLVGEHTWADGVPADALQGELCSSLFLDVLRILPHLATIRITNCVWKGTDVGPIPHSSSLQCIVIDNVECTDWDGNILDVVATLRHVGHLALSRMCWQHTMPGRNRGTASLHVSTLLIDGSPSWYQASGWEHHTPSIAGLRTLTFKRYVLEQAGFLRRMIRENIATLRELTLTVEEHENGG